MTAFYFAGFFGDQEIMRKRREELVALGHIVTSSWLDAEHIDPSNPASVHAGTNDLKDIDEASTLLLFTDKPSSTGGYHVEFGYAMGRNKITVVIGPYNCIFQRQTIYHYEDWNDFKRSWPL